MKKRKSQLMTIGGSEVKVFTKNAPAQIKSVDKEQGIVEAYVSIFGVVDSYGDIVQKGAFADSLKRKLPKVVWGHNWQEIIGPVLEAREDKKGLYVKFKLTLEVQRAREALALMKDSAVDEFSFGYVVDEKETDDDGNTLLTKLTVFEISPVLIGANPDTELISVKSAQKKDDPKPEPDSIADITSKKGDVQEIVDERTKRDRKWEKFGGASKIFDALWSAYFADDVEVDDFDGLLGEAIKMLQELVGDTEIDEEKSAQIIAQIKSQIRENRHAEAAAREAKNDDIEAQKSAVETPAKKVAEPEKKENDDSQKSAQIVQTNMRKSVKALNFALYIMKQEGKK